MEKIVLYYRYITIANPQEIADWQRSLCTELNLLGRILIAPEGINGTVSGPEDTIAQYKKAFVEHPLFADIVFKEEDAPSGCFPRLQVTVKKNIVNFQATADLKSSGTPLTPAQVHDLIQSAPENFIIFDARNDFESRVGKFDNAITPTISHYRDLHQYIDDNQNLFAKKEVLMYCTGGIRCEFASAYLQEKGIAKKVMQLEGGIINYIQQYPDGFFRGKNYVFDGRVCVPVTTDILATCDLCPTPCDEYTHCLNAACNKQFIGCATCLQTLENSCSRICLELITVHKVAKRLPFKRATFESSAIAKKI